jgi:Putative zinc dependent peptidase (DUF5700)
MPIARISLTFLVVCAFLAVAAIASSPAPRLNVQLVTGEADAVLAILAKRNAHLPITESDWQRVFSSEGYIRLKQRETAMKRSFEDADFKNFALSDQLAQRAPDLERTLAKWKQGDINRAAKLALAYLPKSARISAKIYPVIKPRENSFVFGLPDDPAIFIYLDPAKTEAQFENTLAHELHHIGYGSGCPSKQTANEIERLPANTQTVLMWVGAFGEGFAMLAAGGGPDAHPHAVSSPEDRARWDRDVSNFNDDLQKVETFFIDILDGRLTKDEAQKIAASFYGVQGPWYTVGWQMLVIIEKTFGRTKLIESMCDQRKLLSTYNAAAKKYNRKAAKPRGLWSERLVKATSKR